MELMKLWNSLKSVPASALKPITFGKLKGKSDISPQWRMERLTEVLGACGIGWKYEIIKEWTTTIIENESVMCFVHIHFYHKIPDNKFSDTHYWSDPIPAIGGNFLIVKDKNGVHGSDDGYKMALTDAIGVAGKAIGLASDIYMGMGSKYTHESMTPEKVTDIPEKKPVFLEAQNKLRDLLLKENNGDKEGASNQLHVLTRGKHNKVSDITEEEANGYIILLEK